MSLFVTKRTKPDHSMQAISCASDSSRNAFDSEYEAENSRSLVNCFVLALET